MKKEDFRQEMIWSTAQVFSKFIPSASRQAKQGEIISELKELFDNENVKTPEDAARILKETYPHFFEWAKIVDTSNLNKSNAKTSKWVTFIGVVLLISIIAAIISLNH